MSSIVSFSPSSSMSSLEIAELTGKRHDNVVRDLRELESQGVIGLLSFEELKEIKDLDGHGKGTRTIYHLPKRETLILTSGYSATQRATIIDRWLELEKAQLQPTPTDNARLLEAQNERIRLTIQVREAFADDAIMQSIVADAIKNTLGGQAALPAPALFQAYEILEEAGFTPKGIRSVGPTFGRRLAKAWREETGQQPLTTKRVIDGATRNVKCYPESFKAQALGIAMGLH